MTADHPTTTFDPAAPEDRRELVLSEEHLAVSTVRVPTRRVRLEKYVVTETRTITVEVSREEVRLVELDPTDDGAAAAADASGDPGRWLVLSEERVETVTSVVPVERVRLAVTSVQDTQTVVDDVRREQVALDPVDPRPDADPTTRRDPR